VEKGIRFFSTAAAQARYFYKSAAYGKGKGDITVREIGDIAL
jgi:hypothetical protein